MSSSTNTAKKVPYFVLHLSDGKSKALFTVPSDMAETLIQHPVLCRGASFDLEIDVVSIGKRQQQQPQSSRPSSSSSAISDIHNHKNSNNSSVITSYLSTEFYSPDPEETAHAISERIAIRMGGPPPLLSQLLSGTR